MDVITFTIPYTNEPQPEVIEAPVEEVVVETTPALEVPQFEKPAK